MRVRFGAWVVEGELGRGGMGVVYAAVHRESGERRALKVVHAPAGAEQEVARFSREVRVCMALSHPHVVRVVGVERVGPEDGAPPAGTEPCCLVLELCDGGSLADRVGRDGPLPVRQALELFDGVLAGLGHVHQEHGVVHRDIKPHNILLSHGSDGRTMAKLADFGLAKAYDSAGLSGLTHTGVVMGTPAFMPRAQLINYKYATPEVDVWSTAASLYYVLTGTTPRDLPPGWDPWLAVAGSPVVPVGRRGAGLPPGLCEVLDHALSDEPDGGFRTAGALRAALDGS
ncbi:serine/threonine-protein kinase [Streptomyces sp. NPDC052107]|uniref:serine/threonine-protein kinase n=1 Tax=Streptomyces sp. NPDC052107 TaxID=3155632 RepID=UPI00343FDAEC